jgi:hypothetical protein
MIQLRQERHNPGVALQKSQEAFPRGSLLKSFTLERNNEDLAILSAFVRCKLDKATV